jgi:hypothetical protein
LSGKIEMIKVFMLRKNKLRLLFLTILLINISFVSACVPTYQEPEPEPVPSLTPSEMYTPSPTIDWFPRTQTPTQAPQVTPTQALTLTGLPSDIGEVLLIDDFSDTTLWTTSRTSDGNVVYGNNALSLAVSGNRGVLNSISQHLLPSNFYLQIVVDVALCSPGDQYGVIFWWKSPGESHRLMATCEGSLRLERLTGESGLALSDWQVGSRIRPGSPSTHTIALWANAGEIRVYVNNTYQFSAKTVAGLTGNLGVVARAGGTTAETVVFSQLEIYELFTEP